MRTAPHRPGARPGTARISPAALPLLTLLLAALLVPLLPAPAQAREASPVVAACRADTGPYQRELERHLKRPVDGRQSEADCRAIRAFQQRHKIPATGMADVATYRTVLVQQARSSPAARAGCPRRTYRVVCVDLARQILWVQTGRDGKLALQPIPVRTGRQGLETRGGWHKIFRRVRHEVSRLYDNEPMPYSQYFDGGQALHGTTRYLYSSGSAGCVNLRLPDAAALWRLLRVGDRVFVFGVKPGTNPRILR
ncbi:L,D-transpeptidase family protein [Streptomyces sp. NPDC048172]|uniref:L,D-transpeptidase family protein n=1 Tax=Streptomyces sp. NPDC048172 TaxID=3365505 RepID=UPI00372279DD